MPPRIAPNRRAVLRALAALPALGLLPLAATGPAAAAPVGSGSGSMSTGSGSAAADLGSKPRPDWMGVLPDATLIAAMSIPGTHDTMAYGASLPMLTQDSDLPTQLLAGVRALDVRARHFRDAFTIHHDLEYLHANFADVVRQACAFLRANPSETLLIRLKNEHTEVENTRSYEDTLSWYAHDNPETADLLRAHLWTPPAPYDDQIPTLGQARGKVVILQDFTSTAPYGPRWSGAAMRVQDDYMLSGLGEVPAKWGKVRAHFEAARAGNPQSLFVNHLSATFSDFVPALGGTVPVTVAKGVPGVTGMVDRTRDYLRANGIGRTGVVMTDFPTTALLESIIACNFA